MNIVIYDWRMPLSFHVTNNIHQPQMSQQQLATSFSLYPGSKQYSLVVSTVFLSYLATG